MKLFAISVALVGMVFLAGCVNHLPKPVNANGSVNPSVAVAEAKIAYTNAANDAATYIETCHRTVPTPIGCDDRIIEQLKMQSPATLAAINAAENAVKTLQPGATGIDAALSRMNVALVFLQSLLTAAHHPVKTSMLQTLHILEGVMA